MKSDGGINWQVRTYVDNCKKVACDQMEGSSTEGELLQGGIDGSRKIGIQAKSWIDNINEWTGLSFIQLIRTAEEREAWKTCMVRSIILSPPMALKLWGIAITYR